METSLPKTAEGLATIPFSVDFDANGSTVLGGAFCRSYGGVLVDSWYTVKGGQYQLVFRDPTWKESSLEINKWYRAGLFSPSQFSDSIEQKTEKLAAGRCALNYYDFSQDAFRHFRKLLMESHPDDTYEIVKPFPYPPAKGLPTSKIYPDYKETIGWNVTSITKNAKQPARIHELWSYFLTQEASVTMMYGPQGQLWDQLNSKGLPILKKPESAFTSDEVNKLGLWFWAMPGQSDNIDNTKFAVNELQPPEKQDWVISIQANILSPIMWVSDEFVGINLSVDPKSAEGIARQLCEDYIKGQYPKMVMAPTAAEAGKIYDDIVAFCDKNGLKDVEALYAKKYKDNVAKYGTGLNK